MPSDSSSLAAAHPRAPGEASQRFSLEQRFSASPAEVWAYVSDTDRINRAAGIPEAKGTYEAAEGGRVLIGRAKQLGFTLEWVEHPFEHVAGQRFGVLREYRAGPLSWMRSVVELKADGHGTLLTQTFEAQPRSVMYAPVVAAELGVRLKRAFQRVYEELEQYLATPEDQRDRLDPLAPTQALSGDGEREMTRLLKAAHANGATPHALMVLEMMIRQGDPRELGRLRPIDLAHRAGLAEDVMIDACLIAADVGLLQLRWDLLCPHCRVASSQLERPEDLDAAGRCEACDIAVPVDPMSSVELVFRPHPSVREVEVGTYCLGAPAHSPHVVAQQVLAPGERLELRLQLPAGAWAVTSGHGLFVELDVLEDATSSEATITLSAPPARVDVSAHGQLLILVNDTKETRRVRVEDGLLRATVLSAARAAARSLELKDRGASAPA